ncbi:phage virion morphogenesis protein [Cellulosilyticum sp. I15G10I2]|uniref:phage virion morphogenesis protein n=1 Tax=Cellulosilyticum sp. I15G10I2 TaxID=1892843 RepID=UPI00085CC98D|nr:phage virion morphogenesis protein [Cellulosilyticum sp. I15G10I2]
MAGVRLDGDIRRLKNTLRNMGELQFKVANAAIGQVLRSSTLQRFAEGKDPEGRAWAQSNKYTISSNGSIRKSRKKTLIETARLKNSIKAKVTNKGVAIGTNTIYAATHQLGDDNRTIRARGSKGLSFVTPSGWRRKKIVKVTIPARPFLGISDEDMIEIKATMNHIIEGAVE